MEFEFNSMKYFFTSICIEIINLYSIVLITTYACGIKLYIFINLCAIRLCILCGISHVCAVMENADHIPQVKYFATNYTISLSTQLITKKSFCQLVDKTA